MAENCPQIFNLKKKKIYTHTHISQSSNIENLKISKDNTTKPIAPLFNNDEEYKEFKERHYKAKVTRNDLSTYEGDAFRGVYVMK